METTSKLNHDWPYFYRRSIWWKQEADRKLHLLWNYFIFKDSPHTPTVIIKLCFRIFFFEERSLMHYMKGKSGTTRKLTSIIIIISFLKVDFYITFYNFKKPITVKSIQCTVGSDFSPVNRIAHDQVKITWIRNGNMSHFIANRLDLPNRHAFDGRFHVKWRKAKKLPFKENANPIISSHMLSIVSLCNQS